MHRSISYASVQKRNHLDILIDNSQRRIRTV
nr:MAG TPA: hypothetical protein [Caudoviricetes sp.]